MVENAVAAGLIVPAVARALQGRRVKAEHLVGYGLIHNTFSSTKGSEARWLRYSYGLGRLNVWQYSKQSRNVAHQSWTLPSHALAVVKGWLLQCRCMVAGEKE